MNNAIEGIRKSIEEIISETDEAQLLLYTVEEDIQILQKDNAKLKAENAELSELVRDMWQTISRDDGCGWDMDANCCTSDKCNASCRYWHRMKELGIEAEVEC